MSGSDTWVMHDGIEGGRWDNPNIPLNIPSAAHWLLCDAKCWWQGETEARSSMELTSWHFLAGKAVRGMGRTETFLPTPAPRRRDAHDGDPIKRTQLALI